MKWISVKEKLPSLNEIVFALIEGKFPTVAKFSGDCFTDDGLEVEDVTHWMQIPSLNEEANQRTN